MFSDPLDEEIVDMNTSRARENLLSTHEHIIRVRVALVLLGRHRIERTHSSGKLVEYGSRNYTSSLLAGQSIGCICIEFTFSRIS
jgi:hypothetical protein